MLRRSFKSFNPNQKRQMSLQKPDQPQYKQKPRVQKLQNLSAVVHTTRSTRFHVLTAGGKQEDKTILWKLIYPDPPSVTSIRRKHLVLKNIEYIISNWTEDEFPTVLYIRGQAGTQDIVGYNKQSGPVSNRIAALQLSSAQAVMDQSSVRTYELKYVLRDSCTWEIPTATTEYVFRMTFDDVQTPIMCPLPNPITLNIEIRIQ